MYLDAMEMSDYPFIQSARDELYLVTEESLESTHKIHHWIESGHGMLLLTGSTGVGRTSLIHHALSTSQLQVDFAVIGGVELSDAELLHYVALELGLKPSVTTLVTLRHAIRQRLKAIARDTRRVCLIIENAEGLEPRQIALLQDLTVDHSFYLPLCLLVLIGDESMGQSVREAKVNEQAHGVSQIITVNPLDEKTTHEYIEHRLIQVTSNVDDVFPETTVQQIYQQTAGNPAAINLLCDQALIQATIYGELVVRPPHLVAAVNQLGWCLKNSSGPGALERSVHQLIQEVTTIGRAPDCSIRINQSDISPCQALIVKTEDGWFIRSEGHESPIYLNASPVETATLREGDTVKIGDYELVLSTDQHGMAALISVPALNLPTH